MKVLLTGAEIRKINDLYDVVYKERIVVRKVEFEQALMLAVDEKELNKLINPTKSTFK